MGSTKKKTLLITGGSGFIGSHLTWKYISEAKSVKILDDFSSGSVNNIRGLLNYRNMKLVRGDVRDKTVVDRASEGVDIILHLAAQVHVDKSIISPRSTFEVNTLGTLNVLDSALQNEVELVVYASSSEVYGSALYVPIDERHPLNPASPYAASKAAADRLCFSYYSAYKLPVVIIRSFNTYGPRQARVGYTAVVPRFIKRLLSGLPPVIYGDGMQTRDYMYIEDTLRAYDLVLNSYEKLMGKVVNFGTGRETSISELANLMISLIGLEGKIKPIHVSPRPGEVRRLCADIRLARKELDFETKHTMRDGLEETIKWYEEGRYEELLPDGEY